MDRTSVQSQDGKLSGAMASECSHGAKKGGIPTAPIPGFSLAFSSVRCLTYSIKNVTKRAQYAAKNTQ